jgi:hypothetical protein
MCKHDWKEKGTYWFSGKFGSIKYKCKKCKCVGLKSYDDTIRPLDEFKYIGEDDD